MKIVFGDPKTGKCFQKELEAGKETQFYGKNIGEKFEGGLLGLPGYELEITGGSNKQGTPMVPYIQGQRKLKATLPLGVGVRNFKKKRPVGKGQKVKKRVCGDTVSEETAQINARITTQGAQPLAELGFTPKEKKAEVKK
ncbi:MAG: S6e family ribosomal protein [Candidatus Micrarchaeia archaeon]